MDYMSTKRYDQIHETAVKEVLDLFDGICNALDSDSVEEFIKGRKGKYTSNSIARATSDMTLVFPVISSKAVGIDTACMVTKAIERKCVVMLQMLFSAYQVSNKKDAMEFIRQFHGNLDTRTISVDDFLSFFEESAGPNISKFRMENIRQDLIHNTNYYLPSNISEHTINDYKVYNNKGKPQIIVEARYLNEADNPPKKPKPKLFNALSKDDREFLKSLKDKADKNEKKITDNDYASYVKNYYEGLNKQVLNADIKKANELMPTPLVVSYKYYDPKSDMQAPIEIESVVIGVKCKLYYVDSQDIVNRIINKTVDKNWITQFIRGSTREISFWKDFVLAIDRAKIDALSFSNRGNSSKMWKALERRASNSKLRRVTGSNTGGVSAITTLLISQEEVELIKRLNNIDVERLTIVRNLLDGYNLLCFCIADDSLECAKFLFDDNDPSWETISYNHLEREASDNSYKKVVNMMTKVAR